ncbi:hypothetical protein FRB95_004501 [Tulasnella sp. JGI-2019a]|nr:hypothetical protein FRB95_004501 [Tulasnella sp. JGI-2019a]
MTNTAGPMMNYNLELWCYGWENQKAQIKLRPKIPLTKDLQRKGARRAIESLPRLSNDVKHCRNWNCEGCGKIAREHLFSVASYMHLKPPMIIVFVHFLCDAGYGPCLDSFDEMNKERSEALGHPFVPQRRRAGPGQPLEPMSTTCAGCHDDKTSGMELSQCSRCHLTRFVTLIVNHTRLQSSHGCTSWPYTGTVARNVKRTTTNDTKSGARPFKAFNGAKSIRQSKCSDSGRNHDSNCKFNVGKICIAGPVFEQWEENVLPCLLPSVFLEASSPQPFDLFHRLHPALRKIVPRLTFQQIP